MHFGGRWIRAFDEQYDVERLGQMETEDDEVIYEPIFGPFWRPEVITRWATGDWNENFHCKRVQPPIMHPATVQTSMVQPSTMQTSVEPLRRPPYPYYPVRYPPMGLTAPAQGMMDKQLVQRTHDCAFAFALLMIVVLLLVMVILMLSFFQII